VRRRELVPYGWVDAGPTTAHPYLLPAVRRLLGELSRGASLRVVDLGCGNGFVAAELMRLGHRVIAVDASADGVEIARRAYPGLEVLVGSVYDDGLVDRLGGPADCVLALEVLEHLFLPRKLFERSREVLKPSGALVLSTPYHGYLKNLAISLAGGWDRHFRVDWDGGHIKFFSKKTLAAMAAESGFHASRFVGVGRLPWLWKSMILVARK
jgi:2-polyprenyl-3-methyl-5-hydroxy-6-metoxy-1,4-benzoquinol methylase